MNRSWRDGEFIFDVRPCPHKDGSWVSVSFFMDEIDLSVKGIPKIYQRLRKFFSKQPPRTIEEAGGKSFLWPTGIKEGR